MKPKITAGINFSKSKMKWSEVSNHNNRKYNIKHSKNNNINPIFSKFNRYGHLLNYYQIMVPYIDKSKLKQKYDKCLTHRQKSRARKFASAKSYLRSKHYRNTRCGVITIGNSLDRKRLERLGRKSGYSTAQCRQYEAKALYGYISQFNNYHKHIKINHFAIHSDETFIHAHAEFVGLGAKTKTGRVSFNFNNALKLEEHEPNNKKALKKFRAKEDPIIAHSLGGFGLARTGQANNDTQAQHSYAVAQSSKADVYSNTVSYYSSLLNTVSNAGNSIVKSVNDKSATISSMTSDIYSSADSNLNKATDALPESKADSIKLQPIPNEAFVKGSLGIASYKASLANSCRSSFISSASLSISNARASISSVRSKNIKALQTINNKIIKDQGRSYRESYREAESEYNNEYMNADGTVTSGISYLIDQVNYYAVSAGYSPKAWDSASSVINSVASGYSDESDVSQSPSASESDSGYDPTDGFNGFG